MNVRIYETLLVYNKLYFFSIFYPILYPFSQCHCLDLLYQNSLAFYENDGGLLISYPAVQSYGTKYVLIINHLHLSLFEGRLALGNTYCMTHTMTTKWWFRETTP